MGVAQRPLRAAQRLAEPTPTTQQQHDPTGRPEDTRPPTTSRERPHTTTTRKVNGSFHTHPTEGGFRLILTSEISRRPRRDNMSRFPKSTPWVSFCRPIALLSTPCTVSCMANDVKETIERIETANTVLDEVVEEYPDLFEDVEVSVDNHGEELTVSADLPQTRTFGEAVDAATRVAEEFRSYEVVEAVSICVDEKHYDSDEERMVVGDPVPRFNALF